MGRTTNGLIKSRNATTAVPAYRLVVEGPVNGAGALAVDASKSIIGCSSEVDTAVGERISVFMSGNIGEVTAGANVGRGDKITADAQGRAVPTTTQGDNIVGTAEVSGVLGDIITVIIAPGVL